LVVMVSMRFCSLEVGNYKTVKLRGKKKWDSNHKQNVHPYCVFVVQLSDWVSIVSRVQAGWPKNCVQFPAWARNSYLLWLMELAIQWGPKAVWMGSSDQGVECEVNDSTLSYWG
jgi:hypothetical protein